jgi:hypothetical protein
MAIPLEIATLVDRLTQELNAIESEVTEGLNLVRDYLSRFSDSAQLVQLFASLNNAALFKETYSRVIAEIVSELSASDLPPEVIQEIGEDLSALLGRVLDVKINVSQIKTRLQNWI